MERKKHIFLVFFLVLSSSITGQGKTDIYNAYITGNMTRWKQVIDTLGEATAFTNEEKLDLINLHYGYIAWCIDKGRKSEAGKYMKSSEILIEQLENEKYSLSLLYAYKAAHIGFEIGISPYKAPFIGQESSVLVKRALSLDAFNALGHIQAGNIAWYTPAMFGGSREEAMKHYLRALELMEADSSKTVNDWNYLNLLATIINAYIDLKDFQKAKQYCIKTLKVEPGFEWVKNKLYPEVLKELNNE